MPFDHEEAELPRLVREIRLLSERRRNEPRSPERPVAVLAPFAGVLRPCTGTEYGWPPDLTYLTLRPLRLIERVEMVREVHAPTKPERAATPPRRPRVTSAGSERSGSRTRYERPTVERETGRQAPAVVAEASRRPEPTGFPAPNVVAPVRVFHHSRARPTEGSLTRPWGETGGHPSAEPSEPNSGRAHDRRRTREEGAHRIPNRDDGSTVDGAETVARRRETRRTPPQIVWDVVLPDRSGGALRPRFSVATEPDRSEPGIATRRRRLDGDRFEDANTRSLRTRYETRSGVREGSPAGTRSDRASATYLISRTEKGRRDAARERSVETPSRTRATPVLRDGPSPLSPPSRDASFTVVDRSLFVASAGRLTTRATPDPAPRSVADWTRRWTGDPARRVRTPEPVTRLEPFGTSPRASPFDAGGDRSRTRIQSPFDTGRTRPQERSRFEPAIEAAREGKPGETGVGTTVPSVATPADGDGAGPTAGGRPNPTGGPERPAIEASAWPEVRTTLGASRPTVRRVESKPRSNRTSAAAGRRTTTVLHVGTEAATSGPRAGGNDTFGSTSDDGGTLRRGADGDETSGPGVRSSPGETPPTGQADLSPLSSPPPATASPAPDGEPELTLRADRWTADPDGRADGRGPDTAVDSFSSDRNGVEYIKNGEENISPLEPIDGRHMNADVDLDRLVDRLYDRFERKLRTERQRRGL